VPSEVRFVELLPKTANDKVDRKALKLLEESAEAGSVAGKASGAPGAHGT
jgi:acyl-coenzyme A synthetase/AMP-(fatty) acid ligase